MNLIYFEGTTTHIIGMYMIYHKIAHDRIEAKVINDTLVLRKTQTVKTDAEGRYFPNVADDGFLGFIKGYCQRKGIEGLQFVEIAGVYYEMYGGDFSQVRRAIEYCKELTVLTMDGGNIVYHFFDEDLQGEDDDDDDD